VRNFGADFAVVTRGAGRERDEAGDHGTVAELMPKRKAPRISARRFL